MADTASTYDRFSSDYDHFVNWQSRLDFELPFLERQLAALGAPAGLTILDAACGTGMHAIALARQGCNALGADLSAGMIEQARQNASQAGLDLRFEARGFGSLAQVFGAGSSDALLCLGNSLPHLLTPQDLASALSDFAAVLRPDGLLVLQNRNFDAVMERRERWMEPQAHQDDDNQTLFLRFYDYLPDGLIDFNIVVLRRSGQGAWQQQVNTTRLAPLLQSGLTTALQAAGFEQIMAYGGMDGSDFNPHSSGNLILVARRHG